MGALHLYPSTLHRRQKAVRVQCRLLCICSHPKYKGNILPIRRLWLPADFSVQRRRCGPYTRDRLEGEPRQEVSGNWWKALGRVASNSISAL